MDGISQAIALVADDALEDHFDAEIVQFAGEVEGVCVDSPGGQHFRADRDDFGVQRSVRQSFHQTSGRPLIPTSTLWSALVVATIMEREGVKAKPTIPGPERKSSAWRSGWMRTDRKSTRLNSSHRC